ALFLGEGLLLGIAGALLGLPLGMGFAHLALGPMHEILSEIFLPLPATRLQIAASTWISAAIMGLATVLLASLAPALRAACEDPVRALRRLPVCQEGTHSRGRIAVAFVLTLAAVACLALKNWLPPRVGAFGAIVMVDVSGLAV